ncbi:MAG: helix-turn-helix transcriptional regulator [Xanthobacteraceae bacterium]|nr:helix-turn-helix transcriptional regulator [Xanthobacteraceae bacterium]
MHLADYLKHHDLTRAAFASKIGRSEATVSRIVRGINGPNRTTMRAIRDATGGKVTPNDFLPPSPPPSRPRRNPERRVAS